MGLVKQYFTSNGNWIAPAGVTNVIVVGAGGGGAGAGGGTGSTKWAGGGGGGSEETMYFVSVVPNTTYAVTIGAGGTGGAGNGQAGANTTFGSLTSHSGAGGGLGQDNCWVGGTNSNKLYQYCPWSMGWSTTGYTTSWQTIGGGGMNTRNVTSNACQKNVGLSNRKGYAAGSFGTDSSTYYGGAPGGGGPNGNGANGGNGNSSGAGATGSSAAANSGAGGGGGGCGNGTGGNGGSGGSGYLYVLYWD